ncbi:MAG: ABC transporter permease [Candidatus Omnitrophica bacterium]|nr:ABC transporter permease [Candidatus Omnitrophota bacterium]
MLREIFRELFQYRELLRAFTYRNIKIRYKQTIMGFLWAIFMPAVIVLSGIVIKKAIAIVSGRPLELAEIVSVSVKALPWAFFIGAIKFSVNSLVGNMNLVKKIYFPREVFPISYIFVQLFDFLIAIAFLTLVLIFARIGLSIYLLYVPFLIIFLVLFTIGLALILSCGNVFFRDVRYIVDVVLTFGIFFTPVFYEASMFKDWKIILLLNPVASILESMNAVVVFHKMPDIFWFTYAGVASAVMFISGLSVFHKSEQIFAEVI